MKIAISTIAKNEEHNVKDFVKTCQEADLISVLDTGSADKTVKLLKKHKALVGQAKIEPWHFSQARNKALELLPKNIDVVVALDLDERLSKGWRKILEQVWQKKTDLAFFYYIESWQDKEKIRPVKTVKRPKAFKRKSFQWINPVHEIPCLKEKKELNAVEAKGIIVYHYNEQAGGNYINLLTKWLKEEPELEQGEFRYMYRGNDYLRIGKDQEAIRDFEQYLELTRHEQKQCINPDCQKCQLTAGNRAKSHLAIAKAKEKLGFSAKETIRHFLAAVSESPDLREAWTYLADSWLAMANYPAAYGAAMTALSITNSGIRSQELICWGDFPKQIADRAFAQINLNFKN